MNDEELEKVSSGDVPKKSITCIYNPESCPISTDICMQAISHPEECPKLNPSISTQSQDPDPNPYMKYEISSQYQGK